MPEDIEIFKVVPIHTGDIEIRGYALDSTDHKI